MAPRPARTPTTTSGPRGTRCTSRRCSTGSSRTCAGSAATTSSTSPPSNRNAASPRMSTSPSGAPSHAPNSARSYLDPDTGELLPTWDDALDAIADDGEPLHVARFGDRFDAQGVLSGSKDANRCVGYLTKYLTKHVADCHEAATDAQRQHVDRLAAALRYEPCSPTCANWLRYGIQPKNAKPNMHPGACKGKAHRREYLGYAGRRVLVSRKWSGKTLADHRADRKNWLTETLGLSATDPTRYAWEPVKPSDQDHMPTPQRLLHVVADRIRWRAALDEARRRAQGQPPDDLSATTEEAA